ncbi:MAG TPA: trypsin-like serine protease [Thermohalobaculum sp.]|nr:trypsin-like serine protease [Thermohalobaculum sp.]
MMRVGVLFLLVLLVGIAGVACLPAGALELDRHRMLNAEEHEPWRGVGRVNITTATTRSMCTGALIAEDLVLTAAHCVMNPLTGQPYRPVDVHFVAGWRLGQKIAARISNAIAVHPEYRLSDHPEPEQIATDLALIRLAQPIARDQALPFEIAPSPAEGTPLTLISYRGDRPHALTRQQGCEVLSVKASVMALACEVTFGASGSPLFVEEGGRARIVAVVSAKGASRRHPLALSVMVDAALPQVLSALK